MANFLRLNNSEPSVSIADQSALRAAWKAGSPCLIYSRSQRKWMDAAITEIDHSSSGQEEWMKVKYRARTKRIQRYCQDIQPVADDHPSRIQIGSKLRIKHSEMADEWCFGEVMKVFTDQEGEWLSVKYQEDGVSKICDVQRYCRDIQLIPAPNSNSPSFSNLAALSVNLSNQSNVSYGYESSSVSVSASPMAPSPSMDSHQQDLQTFPEIKHILIDTATINARIQALGAEITEYYKKAGEDDELICVGILTGGVLFAADLVRAIKIAHRMEFMRVKSYSGVQQANEVKVLLDLSCDLQGKNILIMEDLIDSGKTMMFLVDYLKSRGAKSVKIACLLQKKTKRLSKDFNLNIDWIGFPSVVDEWIIGYGIDYDQKYRHLPYIASLKESVYADHAH